MDIEDYCKALENIIYIKCGHCGAEMNIIREMCELKDCFSIFTQCPTCDYEAIRLYAKTGHVLLKKEE